MTFPGLGGQQPPPQNAPAAQVPVPGITPGVPPILTVTEIIIVPGGILEGIFTYSSNPPAAGKLIASASVQAAGTDKYGNAFLAGTTTYTEGTPTTWFATSLNGGFIVSYFAASSAGPWSQVGQLNFSSAGELNIDFASVGVDGILATLNNTLDDGSGNASIAGVLTVGGSSSTGFPSPNSTSTNGLSSPGIVGTSGAASAGTAHTHSAGSYVVGSGQHVHDIQDHTHPL